MREGAHPFPAMERGMSNLVIDPLEWAVQQFGTCELGDARRTRRLVRMAAQAATRPDGSTPDQTEHWSDCKAAYRLMDCDDVTHAEIIRPHAELTRQACRPGSVKLILCDTTELDYRRDVAGLGPVGRGSGRGFLLHSGLLRDAESGDMEGLAGQVLFHRKSKSNKKAHKNSKRRDPARESIAWGQLIDQIGPPPAEVRWIHVCDRGADDYEVYCRAQRNACGWVIRAARLNRLIQNLAREELTLEAHLQSQPVQGALEIAVPRQGHRPQRTATVQVRFAPLRMPPPRVTNAWIREHAPEEPLLMWVVEVREEHPPAGVEALHWVLLTSEPITTLSDARQCLMHYQLRWGVEEYHKALKTGCRVEHRYYETAARLERVTGLLAVVAVRLLQIRSLADEEPERPAAEVVPRLWVETLAQVRRRPVVGMTVHQFVRQLAGLGGHLGRKCDGRPGWITLWRGLEKLLLILRGRKLVA